MHPTLHRYILGIKSEKPDFDWKPSEIENILAAAIRPGHIHGTFRECRLEGSVLYINDELLLDKARQFLLDIQKVLPITRIEAKVREVA